MLGADGLHTFCVQVPWTSVPDTVPITELEMVAGVTSIRRAFVELGDD